MSKRTAKIIKIPSGVGVTHPDKDYIIEIKAEHRPDIRTDWNFKKYAKELLEAFKCLPSGVFDELILMLFLYDTPYTLTLLIDYDIMVLIKKLKRKYMLNKILKE
jgi:hypothetical protein